MADYYPLIARAVAALKDARADERAPVYERARNALMNHLKGIQPPVGPEVLEAEELALDEAIARVEAEILSGDVPGQEPAEGRIEAAPVITKAATPAAAEPATPTDVAPPTSQPAPSIRPMAPRPAPLQDSQRPRGSNRAILVAAVAIVAALGVAALAFMTRTDPSRTMPPGPNAPSSTVIAQPAPPQPVTDNQPVAPPDSQPGKVGERVADGPAPTPSGPVTPETTPLPVAQRGIFYEENPDKPGEPTQIIGRTIWRLDTVSVGAGQPPETVVRIDADFPERSLGIEMTIRRNLDPALSASHLMEVRFNFRSGGGSVKELATPPQMKQEENQRGTPLIALQVPVMENFFLVGLSKLPVDVERNISLLESANWIDLPVRLANGRLAVMALEKGTNGAAVVNAALVRWRS
ncbi:MAG: hypothetical protein ACRCYS_00515 [Beijerinckiaceae bacterium]